jgi:hypothetical protein
MENEINELYLMRLLQNKFSEKTYTSLSKSLETIENHLNDIIFPKKILNDDERRRYSVPYSWLFCTLVDMCVTDNNGR